MWWHSIILLHWQALRYLYKRVLRLNCDLQIRERGKQPSWHQDNSTHPQTRDYLFETETWHFICRRMSYCLVCLSVFLACCLAFFFFWKDLQTQAPLCLRGVISGTSWLTATDWGKCTVLVQYVITYFLPLCSLVATFLYPENMS